MKRHPMMKTVLSRLLAVLLAVLCLALPVLALADGAELTVRGTATISIDPDYATLTLGFYAENEELLVAQADAADTVDAIIAAVTALGVEKKDIVTSSLSIGSVYNYNATPRAITGYYVEHMLTITVSNIDQVAAVMNAALDAGANQSYGINFGSSKSGEAYRQALKEAIGIARFKAEAMAEAAGLPLGSLESLSELQEYYYGSYTANVSFDDAGVKESAMGDTIMSGALQVNATVEMKYQLGK